MKRFDLPGGLHIIYPKGEFPYVGKIVRPMAEPHVYRVELSPGKTRDEPLITNLHDSQFVLVGTEALRVRKRIERYERFIELSAPEVILDDAERLINEAAALARAESHFIDLEMEQR